MLLEGNTAFARGWNANTLKQWANKHPYLATGATGLGLGLGGGAISKATGGKMNWLPWVLGIAGLGLGAYFAFPKLKHYLGLLGDSKKLKNLKAISEDDKASLTSPEAKESYATANKYLNNEDKLSIIKQLDPESAKALIKNKTGIGLLADSKYGSKASEILDKLRGFNAVYKKMQDTEGKGFEDSLGFKAKWFLGLGNGGKLRDAAEPLAKYIKNMNNEDKKYLNDWVAKNKGQGDIAEAFAQASPLADKYDMHISKLNPFA